MKKIKITSIKIENIRNVFDNRFTYQDDQEWIDKLKDCIYQLCQEAEVNSVYSANEIERIGKDVISKIETIKSVTAKNGGF
tara:strand:+ start:205 stop:447 length:243 start_codon:yes stop_codon:yes gene_type:complete